MRDRLHVRVDGRRGNDVDRSVVGGEESCTVMEVRAVLLACFGSVKQMVFFNECPSRLSNLLPPQHLQHWEGHQERQSHNHAPNFAVQRFSCTSSPIYCRPSTHCRPSLLAVPGPKTKAHAQARRKLQSRTSRAAWVTCSAGQSGVAKSTGTATGTGANVPAGHGRRGRIAAEAGQWPRAIVLHGSIWGSI